MTRPVGKIIGEFDIYEILCDEPKHIWEKTGSRAGITKEFFDSYFKDRQQGFAIAVGEIRKFDPPLDPKEIIDNFSPPQSFMYLDDTLKRMTEQNETLPLF
ncbi:hypothetical protein ACHMW5_28550 [Azospirillum melinis]|uniref:hypothetical protein n=1 Tax=Azospirillum melinis TaxID=328839 RepID=UPI00375753F5